MCTTMHADTVEEVIEQLELDVGVPRAHLAHLTFVVPLAVTHRDGRTARRVREVGLLGPSDDGLHIERIASWDERNDIFTVLAHEEDHAALARALDIEERALEPELARRESFLQRLLADGVRDIAAVQEAIDAFRREG
jgi:hypothetical protein